MHQKSYKPYLHFISSTVGSIGEISLDLYESLKKDFTASREWEMELPKKREILLCHFYDRNIFKNKKIKIFQSFKVKILIQPIDGTVFFPEFIKNMNLFDVIITPGMAGKKILQKNGVIIPIKVIPNYYKNNLFEKPIYQQIEKYIPNDKIIFYHESSFDKRKGIELMYEGFVRAFADSPSANEVVLIVKDLPYNNFSFNINEDLKKQTIQLQKSYQHPPVIKKFSCMLTQSELKALWNK